MDFATGTASTAIKLPKQVLVDAPENAINSFNNYADNVTKLLPDKDKL
jgi:hypothetical protein